VRRDVGQVLQVLVAGVAGGDGEDLGVGAALIVHPEDCYRPRGHVGSGERGLAEQDHGIERIAVLGEGAGDEAVVGRVAGLVRLPPGEAFVTCITPVRCDHS